MNRSDKLLLEALKASLKNEKVTWDFEISAEDWDILFKKAEIHLILPMIYEAVYTCSSAQPVFAEKLAPMKRQIMQRVMIQVMKTDEFLRLYKHLNGKGIYPAVVKGIVCRQLYPNPDYRSSGDEDVLIDPSWFEICHEAMLEYGMKVLMEADRLVTEYEVPYGKSGSPISIELHKSLFPEESDAYGELNRFFTNVHETAVTIEVQGTQIKTLNYTEHLFYLICHAFKHFLHSGFGIRQVCDIVMFANAYGKMIDWQEIFVKCEEIKAHKFAAALFKIGEKYLVFDEEKANYGEDWKKIIVDETALLDDLLMSGIFGDSDMSRKHSSTITLNAVTAQKEGKKAKTSILKTIFPEFKSMKGKYPYLEKYPYLLPAAWGQRILKYRKESRNSEGNKASESIKIGNQRVELLKEYGIVEK